MDFPKSPARATQVSPDANADHEQSDDSPGNVATLHDVHVRAQTHSSGKPDRKNGLAYWERLLALSQRTCQVRLPRILSSSRMDRIFRRPLLASVSSPLVSDVSTLCGLYDGPCFSLSSTSFSAANRKMDIIDQI